MHCGIYTIKNRTNGKLYVGSSGDCKTRWAHHRNSLRRGDHHSIRLQRAWNKYGEEAFEFALMFQCSKALLVFYEQRAIDVLRPNYNASPTAGSVAGTTRSDESREKMREAWSRTGLTPARRAVIASNAEKIRGMKRPEMSAEHREKIATALRGKHRSQETREKLATAMRGRIFSEETRRKMAESARLRHQRRREGTT